MIKHNGLKAVISSSSNTVDVNWLKRISKYTFFKLKMA